MNYMVGDKVRVVDVREIINPQLKTWAINRSGVVYRIERDHTHPKIFIKFDGNPYYMDGYSRGLWFHKKEIELERLPEMEEFL